MFGKKCKYCNEHAVAWIRLQQTGKGSFTQVTKKSDFVLTFWLGLWVVTGNPCSYKSKLMVDLKISGKCMLKMQTL